MQVTKRRHLDYLTPLSEAQNDGELEEIFRLKWPKSVTGLSTEANFFAEMVREAQEFEAWRVVGFASFEEFCHAKLDMTLDEVDVIVRGVMVAGGRVVTKQEAVELGSHGGDRRSEEVKDQVTNGRLKPISKLGPNTRERTLARLHRDRPDLAAKVEAGELSANAAAIEAGFRKKLTPLDELQRAWKKASSKEKATFRKLIA